MKSTFAVIRHVPEFVRADYPAFVSFLKAYYKWYEEQYIPGNIDDLLDIDSTIAEFVQYFRNQLDIHGITIGLDDRAYLRRIKELYQAKGTFEGIEFLFRLAFNTTSNVLTPWDYVFKPSDGKWYQDVSLLVRVTSGNADDLIGNPVIFTDVNGDTYKTFVSNVNTRTDNIVELFVNRFQQKATISTVASVDGTITGFCQLTTTKVRVEKGGQGFRIGQVFEINSNSGSGTLVKVKQVDVNGSIRAAEIIKFGTRYASDFNVLISASQSVDYGALGARIQLGAFTYQTNDNISAQTERGQIVRHDYTDLGSSYINDPTFVGDVVGEISSQPQTLYFDDTYASLRFVVGSTCIYPGYYKNNDNIIGDLVYIQDSYYYQAFSYVTALEQNIERYAGVLKSTMHPAGTKHFALYQMNYDFKINPQVDPTLNFITKSDALRDFTSTLDEIRFAMAAVFDTQFATVTDALTQYVSYIRTYTDTTTVTDALSRAFAKNGITDTATITEAILLIPGIPMADAFTVIDTITSFNANKYVSDGVQTGFADTSGLYKDPYYVEPLSPAPYWKPEYLTDERAFTN